MDEGGFRSSVLKALRPENGGSAKELFDQELLAQGVAVPADRGVRDAQWAALLRRRLPELPEGEVKNGVVKALALIDESGYDPRQFKTLYEDLLAQVSDDPAVGRQLAILRHENQALRARWGILSMTPENQFGVVCSVCEVRLNRLGGATGEQYSQPHELVALYDEAIEMWRAAGLSLPAEAQVPAREAMGDLSLSLDSLTISARQQFRSTHLAALDGTANIPAQSLEIGATGLEAPPPKPGRLLTTADPNRVFAWLVETKAPGRANAVVLVDDRPYSVSIRQAAAADPRVRYVAVADASGLNVTSLATG